MIDSDIGGLQAEHPWMLYMEGFTLLMDSCKRHTGKNTYSGMARTLMKIDFGIFYEKTGRNFLNRLASIKEFL